MPLNDASADVVRTSVLSLVVEALVAAGAPGTAVLRRHGWSAATDIDPYGVVSLTRYVSLFEEAAAALGEPSLGLRLGRDLKPSSLGPMGVLVVSRPTLRSALDSIVAHIGTLQGGTINDMREEGDLAVFEYRIASSAIWPRRQDAEFSLVATCSLIRILIGSAWVPLEVQFEHARGPDARALQKWFGVAPRFGESANRLIFARTDLDLRPLRPNERGRTDEIVPLMERHLSDLRLDRAPTDLPEKVRTVVRRRFGRRDLDLASIATDLGLSARTLQRELAARDLSFGALLAQCRRERAKVLLADGAMTLDDIARDLGYADASAFSRAFKGWTGRPPRRALRSKPRIEP